MNVSNEASLAFSPRMTPAAPPAMLEKPPPEPLPKVLDAGGVASPLESTKPSPKS